MLDAPDRNMIGVLIRIKTSKDGRKIPDKQIKEWICELLEGEESNYGKKDLPVQCKSFS